MSDLLQISANTQAIRDECADLYHIISALNDAGLTSIAANLSPRIHEIQVRTRAIDAHVASAMERQFKATQEASKAVMEAVMAGMKL